MSVPQTRKLDMYNKRALVNDVWWIVMAEIAENSNQKDGWGIFVNDDTPVILQEGQVDRYQVKKSFGEFSK